VHVCSAWYNGLIMQKEKSVLEDDVLWYELHARARGREKKKALL
jgi:hypothetical protein